MERDAHEKPKDDLQGVYKTIFLFLKNQNFPVSSETFRKECESFGCQIPDISGRVILLPAETLPTSTNKQTVLPHDIKNESFILESSFQEPNIKLQQEVIAKRKDLEEAKDVKKHNIQCNKNYQSLKTKFVQLQDEHKKLIAVTAELTNALQLNIIGQTKNIHNVLDQCRTIYPTLFLPKETTREDIREIETAEPKEDNILERGHASSSNGSPSDQETAIVDNQPLLLSTVPTLNLDNAPPKSSERDTNTCTPLSERDIKDILEILVSKVMQRLSDGEMSDRTDCCDTGRTCASCRQEISKIVESVLEKVLESPRYKLSPGRLELNCTRNESRSNTQSPEKCCSRENTDSENDSITNIQTTESSLKALKNDLMESDIGNKILILQTLRWRLTKSDALGRNETLDLYVNNDLFGIQEEIFLPEKLLLAECTVLNEYVFRLLNAVASFHRGRAYLTRNERLIKLALLPALQKNLVKPLPVITDMLMGILQKISLRSNTRNLMVQAGVFKCLVSFLDDYFNHLSLYAAERSMALLMNLCESQDGLEYCSANGQKIIALLKKFLSGRYTSCLPYVNGILLNILTREGLVSESRTKKIDEVLQRLTKSVKDGYIERQMSFLILSRFNKEIQSFIGDDDDCPVENELLEVELDTDVEYNEESTFKRENTSEPQKNSTDLTQMANLDGRKKDDRYLNSSADDLMLDLTKTSPVSVISGATKRKVIRRLHNFPNSSFCYLEISHEMHDGTKTCRCHTCTPGKSRYSCSCYDIICKEISEETENVSKTDDQTKCVKETHKRGSTGVTDNLNGNTRGNHCSICGDKKCECAFESRPKIHRTPPKS